jgi:hypothetical protein
MVSDLRDRTQVERFLRNATAAELLDEHSHLKRLLAQATAPAGETEHLAARIAYELRFRVPQPI